MFAKFLKIYSYAEIIFYDTFQHNVPLEHYCLQHRIRKVSPLLTKTVMSAPENYENTRDIPKDLFVYLSVFPLICGPDTPSQDSGRRPVLGNKTVRDRRLRLGARTDDRTCFDSTLFFTYWPRVVHG